MTLGQVVGEVDRYIGNPGQACAYMLGRLAIEDIRSRAEARLGERFDIRAFHDHVLATGSDPARIPPASHRDMGRRDRADGLKPDARRARASASQAAGRRRRREF